MKGRVQQNDHDLLVLLQRWRMTTSKQQQCCWCWQQSSLLEPASTGSRSRCRIRPLPGIDRLASPPDLWHTSLADLIQRRVRPGGGSTDRKMFPLFLTLGILRLIHTTCEFKSKRRAMSKTGEKKK